MGKHTSMGGFFFGCFGSVPKRISQGVVGCPDATDSTVANVNSDDNLATDSGTVKRYTWKEIEEMTMSFSEVVGLGGFSTVYLGRLPGSAMAAVKVYKGSDRLNQVFRSEVEITSQLSHPNIVRLLGYCDERDEGVLVFEYIPNGTLHEKLQDKVNTPKVLPWRTRMAIAYELAQSLDYLHDQRSPHTVHGDIKASNILLFNPKSDGNATHCKLCDFGFAKTGFSSTLKPNSSSSSSSRMAMMGSPGYIDPHYLMTGIASKKSDVYSYGVVLLELITGVEAFPAEHGRSLTSLVRKGNGDFDVGKVMGMVDQKVGAVKEEAVAMAKVAAMCLHHLPSLRPSAAEVCQVMRENICSVSMLCESKKD